MKIDDRIINYEINKQLVQSTPNEAEKVNEKQSYDAQKAEEKDRTTQQDTVVHLSQASKEVQLIKEVISSEPDIREDKVAELKERIQSGQYRIDHNAVADKLVDAFLDEKI